MTYCSGREQRVPGGHAGDGGLALDELGAILGTSVSSIEAAWSSSCSAARKCSGPVILSSRSVRWPSHRMIKRRYRLTKVPRPGTVCAAS
jgi:hypothetical protein